VPELRPAMEPVVVSTAMPRVAVVIPTLNAW